jgi:hypothetical protein
MPDSAVYEPWDCDLTGTLPERSHLYHLRPIGVGTEGVESLTCYVARLAEAHNVGTGVLLTRELLPGFTSKRTIRRKARYSNRIMLSFTTPTY